MFWGEEKYCSTNQVGLSAYELQVRGVVATFLMQCMLFETYSCVKTSYEEKSSFSFRSFGVHTLSLTSMWWDKNIWKPMYNIDLEQFHSPELSESNPFAFRVVLSVDATISKYNSCSRRSAGLQREFRMLGFKLSHCHHHAAPTLAQVLTLCFLPRKQLACLPCHL